MLSAMFAPFSALLRYFSRLNYMLSLNDASRRLSNVEAKLSELKTSGANLEEIRKELGDLLKTAHGENKLIIERKITELENASAEIAADIAFYSSRHLELGHKINRLRRILRKLSED